MGQPRFLLLHGAARRLSGPIPPEADGTSAVAWRLVSANNRELGRSAVYHWGADACVRAIQDLVRTLDERPDPPEPQPGHGAVGVGADA